MTSDSKGYLIRSTGLTSKFSMSHDVLQFQGNVWHHLITHGMDTIAYLQDSTDSSKVINVIDNLSRFTADLKTTKKAADIFYNKFDKHDLSNDSAAKAFLLDSLKDKFATIVIRKIKEEDSFAMVWLKMIKLVVAPSLDRWDIIKDKIKAASPIDYPGQNIRFLCQDYEDWAKTLQQGGQDDHALTRTMVKNVLKSKDLPPTYQYRLSHLQVQVDTAL